MRTFHKALLGSFVVMLAACGSGTKDPNAPIAPQTPDPNTSNNNNTSSNNTSSNNNTDNNTTCQNGQQQCSGMDLMVCKNGAWATNTCDYLCQQAGFGNATGCMHDANKGYETCFCASSSGTCQEGEQKCSGMTLSICNGGSWSTAGCDFICQQAGLGPAQSCGFDTQKNNDVCFCGATPSCQNGAQKCQGNSLQTCNSGAWSSMPCDELCHTAGYGMAQSCSFNPNKGLDTCSCYEGFIGDPCKGDIDCKQGVCNNAGWCTKACAHDYECGSNTVGDSSYCMETQGGGGACFPSCTSNTTCGVFAGTSCFFNIPSMDNASASVCSKP